MYFRSLIHRMEGESVRKEDHLNEQPITSEKDRDKDPRRESDGEDKSIEPPSKRLKIKRFQIEDDSNSWTLPDELADYAF